MEIKFVESAVFIFLIICLYFFDELGNILTELSDFSPIKSEKPIVTTSINVTPEKIPYKQIKFYFNLENLPIKRLYKLLKIPLKFQLYFDNLLDQKNLKPWPIIKTEPNSTVFPFIHIPKTGGETWWSFIHNMNSNSKILGSLPYGDFNFYPPKPFKSLAAVGCKNGSISNTHCSYSEMRECFDRGMGIFGDLSGFSKEDVMEFIRNRESGESDQKLYEKKFTSVLDLQSIKFMSLIRNPIVRVLSEYYWWGVSSYRGIDDTETTEYFQKLNKTKNSRTKRRSENIIQCAGAWPNDLCPSIPNLIDWINHENNTAHNRQVHSLVPDENYKNGFDFTKKCNNIYGKGMVQQFISRRKENAKDEPMSDLEMIKDTINNIENNFSFVGLTDNLVLSKALAKIVYSFIDQKAASMIINLATKEQIAIYQMQQKSLLKNKPTNLRTKRNLAGSHSTAGRMPKDFDKDLLYAILKKNRMDFLVYRFLVEKFKISLEFYGNLTSSATNKLGL